MDDFVWFDEWVQVQMDVLGDVPVSEPLPPDDGWFVEVEPGTPDEPDWFVEERAALYAVGVGG